MTKVGSFFWYISMVLMCFEELRWTFESNIGERKGQAYMKLSGNIFKDIIGDVIKIGGFTFVRGIHHMWF